MARITEAQERALRKAQQNGFIMAAGGFSPEPHPEPIDANDFDTSTIIDRLVTAGWLAYGGGWNQYQITPSGQSLLADIDALRRSREHRKAEAA